jgi:hypothetical protein
LLEILETRGLRPHAPAGAGPAQAPSPRTHLPPRSPDDSLAPALG